MISKPRTYCFKDSGKNHIIHKFFLFFGSLLESSQKFTLVHKLTGSSGGLEKGGIRLP